jgi:hypothetical protein
MTTPDTAAQPLLSERSIYMQRAAAQTIQVLERFSGGPVEYGPTALQLLDEWIDRVRPLSGAARVLAIALLGQTFIHRHGGYWATRVRGKRQNLGVVCPVAGSGGATHFIDVADQVGRRLAQGISASLTFFYLTTSVNLQGFP